MNTAFTVAQLIKLAKIGSRSIAACLPKNPQLWDGILPGAESETFTDIEQVLMEKFPNGVIIDDIS